MKIYNFKDLQAWQINHNFVLAVYNITKTFPKEELFGLTNQLRRAASSITANISEGFGRYFLKDKLGFYYFARGSNMECQNHVILAKDLGYISEEQYDNLYDRVNEGGQILAGLIRSTRSQIS